MPDDDIVQDVVDTDSAVGRRMAETMPRGDSFILACHPAKVGCRETAVQLLVTVARWETILLVAAFGIVALWRLLQDGSFVGLLRSNDGTFSPGRPRCLC